MRSRCWLHGGCGGGDWRGPVFEGCDALRERFSLLPECCGLLGEVVDFRTQNSDLVDGFSGVNGGMFRVPRLATIHQMLAVQIAAPIPRGIGIQREARHE
ncbi:MAG: hypothetical protein EXR68_07410 [Dehalococcoidia bacterium]|nr:hypothetical protein [Dehalococcoidia bacterium]